MNVEDVCTWAMFCGNCLRYECIICKNNLFLPNSHTNVCELFVPIKKCINCIDGYCLNYGIKYNLK